MNISPEAIASAIYIAEGGNHTHHPYGIIAHYKHTSPHQACLNTILHAERDYHCVKVDRAFIYYLADRYVPAKADLVGNKNWKVNVVRILNL